MSASKKTNLLLEKKFHKVQAVPFERIQNFSEKMWHSAEKTQRFDPLVSPLLLEASENFVV